MKKILWILMPVLICVSSSYSQGYKVINGYRHDVSGEILDYHSCHPDANTSLLIRCLNQEDAIEWETDSIPSGRLPDTLVFGWIGGFSTGTSTADHVFHLFVNQQEYVTFITKMHAKSGGFQSKGSNGVSLSFTWAKTDHVGDFFGYFFLKVPFRLMQGSKVLRIKIKGDASGSRDWYMTMRYSYQSGIKVTAEEAIFKTSDGKGRQRVKLSVDHFDRPARVEVYEGDRRLVSDTLKFGQNEFYLPFEAVAKPENRTLVVKRGKEKQPVDFMLSPVKQFTVYLLPHAHVDIGYTALQTEVEKKQNQNIDDALAIAGASAAFPEGARFKWNVEVLWPVENYLRVATPEKKKAFYEAVKTGVIGLDGLYANVLTGLCRNEELNHLFDYAQFLNHEINTRINSAMIVDIPGYAWDLVPAMASHGIKYFCVGPNNGDRIGYIISDYGDKPFYWVSRSGKEKVLVWVAGSGYATFHKDNLSHSDGSLVLNYLQKLDTTGYPYDIVQMHYTVGGDNGYADASLPAFVKNWNEKYVSPQFRISTTAEMFEALISKYGDKFPEYSGDFTPYWEEGAASTARETAMNRASADRLIQAEKLWKTYDNAAFPSERFAEAWRQVLLFSEHTWGAWNSIDAPDDEFVTGQWRLKQRFAILADSLSNHLLKDIQHRISPKLDYSRDFFVVNTSDQARTDLVTIPAGSGIGSASNLYAIDDERNATPVQALSDGSLIFLARNVPAGGSKNYHLDRLRKIPEQNLRISGNKMSGRNIHIALNPNTGDVDTLMTGQSRKNWVDLSVGWGLNSYIYTGSNASNPVSNGKATLRIKEQGPVMVSMLVTSTAPGCNGLEREVRLIDGLDRVDFINVVDKKSVRSKESVRFAFPLNVPDAAIRLGLADAVIRPGLDQLAGANKNFYSVQYFADATAGDQGFALAIRDAPIVELGRMTGEAWMNQAGLKNKAGYLQGNWARKAQVSPIIYSWVMNNSWTTNFKADQEGAATFRYSLFVHGSWNEPEVKAAAQGLTEPFVVIQPYEYPEIKKR